jgi:hypothetical protein
MVSCCLVVCAGLISQSNRISYDVRLALPEPADDTIDSVLQCAVGHDARKEPVPVAGGDLLFDEDQNFFDTG